MSKQNSIAGFSYIYLLTMACIGLCSSGCLKKQEHPNPAYSFAFDKPLTPEQSGAVLDETGKNLLYGEAFGETLLNVGGIVLFPPFGLFVLTNAGLSLAGYETMKVADALPEPLATHWAEGFTAISSVPGESAAYLAGENFRDAAKARMSIDKILTEK